jgi:hypothetical protein
MPTTAWSGSHAGSVSPYPEATSSGGRDARLLELAPDPPKSDDNADLHPGKTAGMRLTTSDEL